MNDDKIKIPYSISASDVDYVLSHVEFKATDKKDVVENILFSMGLDTNAWWGESTYDAPHKNLQGSVVDGVRYEGIERTDDEWIHSRGATQELFRARMGKVKKDIEPLFKAAMREAFY